eukprot:gene28950-37977_t
MEGKVSDNIPLCELFSALHGKVFNNILSDGANIHSYGRENLLREAMECKDLLQKEGLFSINEELDDISTESLKYLSLDYLLGKLLLLEDGDRSSAGVADDRKRKFALLEAKDQLEQYVADCVRLRILHEADVKQWENISRGIQRSPDQKRAYKIDKFKREKAIKSRMEVVYELQRLLSRQSSEDRCAGGEWESEDRELTVIQLKSYAGESIDEIELVDQELLMLDYREKTAASDQSSQAQDSRMKQKPGSESRGIEVFKTTKAGDDVVVSREHFIGGVFTPRMAAPSMTLEEFGDLQLLELQQRQLQQQQAPQDAPPKRYKQLAEEGEEDEADLVDQATMKDREWDNWKDNNPRGWGNKMGKRF